MLPLINSHFSDGGDRKRLGEEGVEVCVCVGGGQYCQGSDWQHFSQKPAGSAFK